MADLLFQSDTSIQDDVEVVRIEELRGKILAFALGSSAEEHISELRELRASMKRWIESLPEEEDGISPAKRELIQRVFSSITDHHPLLDYLSNILRDSHEMFLQIEVAYLLFQISTDPAFVAELPSHVYDVLISAMGSAEEAIRSQTIDVILNTTKDQKRSSLNRVKLGHLMIRNLIAVMLNRVQNASDPLAVKACQLIERVSNKGNYFFPQISNSLPFLVSCLHSSKNSVIAAAAEALSACTDGPNTHIEAVISTGSVPRLAELLLTPVEDILHPVLRTVGNIITGDDNQTQTMINVGVVSNLLWLLDYPNKKISREACWTISNISAGSQSQIQEVINAAIVPKVIMVLKTATEEDLQNDAAWSISNILSGGTTEQVDYVISEGGIEAVCDVWKGIDHGKGSKIERPLRDCFDSLVKSAGKSTVEQRERIRERMRSKMVDGSTDKELWPRDVLRFAQQEELLDHEEAEDVSEFVFEEDEDATETPSVVF